MSVTAVPQGAIAPESITPADAARLAGDTSLYSAGELRLTIVIFVFGMIALLGFAMILRTRRATPFVLRMYVILILVFGTLLIVSSAYTTAQIAPVVGFFGTIAGYLLGKTETKGASSRETIHEGGHGDGEKGEETSA